MMMERLLPMNHRNHNEVHINQAEAGSQILLALPFIIVLILYLIAVFISNRHHRNWPLARTVYWVSGVLLAILAVAGPIATRAHIDFTAHMLGHLLLGMLAPLLMVLAAPMTLMLRTISVTSARRLTRVLRSWPSRMFTHPIVASFLNIGGLWLLYTTNLYALMHENNMLNYLVHIHVFIAGYLFTLSMIYIDPILHRISFLFRSIVLIIALAGHGILSKYLYTHPPAGIPFEQAKQGSMMMYYGGDIIDLILIFILCLQWFRATKPRREAAMG